MKQSRWIMGLALLGLAVTIVQSYACPFCAEQKGPTLIGDFNQAQLVLLGKFTNAKLDATGGLDGGTTEFIIEEVFKDHPLVKGKKNITLPRYLPSAKNKFIIFCDVFKGQLDPYRGVEVQPDSDLVKYVRGAVALKDAPIQKRLRYCFDFLNSTDLEVSLDAYREYAKADYDDYKEMAQALPSETLAKWLKDPKTPAFRYGLYASLLSQCGNSSHAKLLRDMIEDPVKRKSSGIDGMLAGYSILLKKENQKETALKYMRNILGNEEEEFLMRYAVLRTMRFFYSTRKDVFSKDEIVASVALTLDHSDMADFGIEDLRKWNRWEKTNDVIALFSKKSHDVPVIRRAILRFALQSPNDAAKQFVKAQEARDSEWVSETRELLALEAGSTDAGG